MTNKQKAALEKLKLLVEEDDGAILFPPCEGNCPGCAGAEPISMRTMTDEQLIMFLEINRWYVERTAYRVLIHKSEASDVALSGGLRLPDQRKHYLDLARLYRPNHGGTLVRADEPRGRPRR